jgi:hypothetical protein
MVGSFEETQVASCEVWLALTGIVARFRYPILKQHLDDSCTPISPPTKYTSSLHHTTLESPSAESLLDCQVQRFHSYLAQGIRYLDFIYLLVFINISPFVRNVQWISQ